MKQIIFCILLASLCTAAFCKDRLAVLPFAGGDGDEGDTLAELFSFTPDINREYEPIPRTSINQAIAAEQDFQKELGVTNADNAASLAASLGADYAACGSITRLGGRKLLIVSILDVNELRLISGDIQSYTAIEDIRSKLPYMARNIVNTAQRVASGLPRLALAPVNLTGGADPRGADTLSQILAINLIRNGMYAVYPRTSSLEQLMTEYSDEQRTAASFTELPNMALSVNARKLGSETMFNAAVIDLFSMVQTAGGSADYKTLEDGVLAMEALALKLSGVNTDYAPDSAETFLEAVDAINSSSTDCVYNIMMNGKFTVDSVSFVPNGKKTIILTGASAGCLISSGGGSSALFTIPEGITLILDGNAALNGNAGTAVTVDVRGGKLIMKKGASIQAGMRGGVMVRGGGSFQMEDGEISGNTRPSGGGGGVYVGIGSSFTMQGGSITGNMAELGGGVYVGGSGASFTMQGGSITGNMGELGGGVYVSGSGASFTMQGGVISANRAERGGGVYIESGRFVKSGGRVESDNSSFDMALVYVFDGGKERINAAGPGVKLDSSRAGQSGGWE